VTDIKREPIKKIIIQDIIHENLENFLYRCYTLGEMSAMWVEGMIIDVIEDQSNLEIGFEKSIEGIRYYEKIIFVKYPQYTKSIKWNGGNYEIFLRNDSNYARLKELAKWVKSQPEWKITPEGAK